MKTKSVNCTLISNKSSVRRVEGATKLFGLNKDVVFAETCCRQASVSDHDGVKEVARLI